MTHYTAENVVEVGENMVSRHILATAESAEAVAARLVVSGDPKEERFGRLLLGVATPLLKTIADEVRRAETLDDEEYEASLGELMDQLCSCIGTATCNMLVALLDVNEVTPEDGLGNMLSIIEATLCNVCGANSSNPAWRSRADNVRSAIEAPRRYDA